MEIQQIYCNHVSWLRVYCTKFIQLVISTFGHLLETTQSVAGDEGRLHVREILAKWPSVQAVSCCGSPATHKPWEELEAQQPNKPCGLRDSLFRKDGRFCWQKEGDSISAWLTGLICCCLARPSPRCIAGLRTFLRASLGHLYKCQDQSGIVIKPVGCKLSSLSVTMKYQQKQVKE